MFKKKLVLANTYKLYAKETQGPTPQQKQFLKDTLKSSQRNLYETVDDRKKTNLKHKDTRLHSDRKTKGSKPRIGGNISTVLKLL